MFSFYNPVKVSFLNKEELVKRLLTRAQGKNIALFLTRSMVERLNLLAFVSNLKAISNVVWIDDVKPNPTCEDIYDKLIKFKDFDIDEVVAIGGGSVIDTAKAVKALYYLTKENSFFKGRVYSSVIDGEYLEYINEAYFVAVPTTSGTGSEVTKWGTLWDKENNSKFAVDDDLLYADEAYLLPEFNINMPPLLTLSTGFDAMSHAIEAFWAKSTNEIVKGISLSAIRIIKTYLPLVKKDPNNLEYRKMMLTASTLAGLAFSQTRTTAGHSFSYPLTTMFNIEHGFAVALVLPYVMETNWKEVKDMALVLEALGLKDIEDFRKWIVELGEPFITLNLRSFGIKEEDIPQIARFALTKGIMDNNPTHISKEQVEKILYKIL